jgi:UDP-N-acetylmuramoyl-tripeptide--D-alanyl-D-alanine ligase
MIISESFLKSVLKCSFIAKKSFEGCDCSPSIDTRTLEEGQLFIALRGDNVDGHNFLVEAVTKGARAVVMEESKKDLLKKIDAKKMKDLFVILVDDVLDALINLASAWRNQFEYPVVGVTGSVGKTSTKEMISTIFSHAKLPVCVSYKNQNTLVGLCMNILRMRKEHYAAILEVGISQRGEMEQKVKVLRPTIGVITTVAHSHMDGLGSLANIAAEKRKIFSLFGERNIGIICGDSPLLDNAYYSHPVVRFGLKMRHQVQARKITTVTDAEGKRSLCFTLKLYKESAGICLKTNHRGYVYNSLAASAVAHQCGLKFKDIVEGIAKYDGFEGRFERLKIKGDRGWLINDCYNANPESMKEALLAAEQMDVPGEKIAVLGDMFELGEKEDFWHRQIGRVLGRTLSIKNVILVGERAKQIAATAPATLHIEYAKSWQEAVAHVEKKLSKDALILVKASHAMHLENLVNLLCE